MFRFCRRTIAMIPICSSLLSLVCRSSTQTGLNFFSIFRTFLHTNLWYRFVLWYTSTLSVHVHNFCNWSYIFHVQILGTCFTDSTFLQRLLHTWLLKFHRTFWTYAEVVLIYTTVAFYTICYIHEILQENLVLKFWIAHFNELC